MPASSSHVSLAKAVDQLTYQPRNPKKYHPKIGLIGCGGITEHHLKAYRAANYDVAMLCDVELEAAEARAEEFYPAANAVTDFQKVLDNSEIEVVDIATHTEIRGPIIEAALRAGKHVLSQKPFVLNLDEGLRLVDVAKSSNRQLAVNQNGRWAPHFSMARSLKDSGLLGDIGSAHFAVHWDHSWTQGTKFETMKHLLLYDFAIHWFDMVQCLFAPRKPLRVYASTCHAPGQPIEPHLLGQAVIEFEDAQATLQFDGFTRQGSWDRTIVTGTKGTFRSSGIDHNTQEVTMFQGEAQYSPQVTGRWFSDGFHGTMGELLCSLEENRISTINAKDNLDSLALCFAAIESVETGRIVEPWSARKINASA